MKELMDGKICKRVVLDKELDGRFDRVSCEMGEERCDVCRNKTSQRKRRRIEIEDEEEELEFNEVERNPYRFQETLPTVSELIFDNSGEILQDKEEEERRFWEEFEEGRRIEDTIRWKRIAEKIEEGVEVEGLIRVLDKWHGQCMICKAKGGTIPEGHRWEECRYAEKEDLEKMSNVLRVTEAIQFERFSGCSFCKVPQKVCHLWEEVNVRGPMRYKRVKGGKCQYEGVLLPVAAAVQAFRFGEKEMDWIDEELRKTGFREGLEDLDDLEVGKKWLGRKIVLGGVEMSELCRLVCMFG